ncbi:MAG: hypothetical protein JST84_33825 [Acidobacteria bacterium]|nr:hypothetical protein [Acidobacteriota bacterium]
MSHNIIFRVEGKEDGLNRLWVHLQEEDQHNYSNFIIHIPSVHINAIFDPFQLKSERQDWGEYIRNNIKEFGTFVLEGYIKLMREIGSSSVTSYFWVLSSISEIYETKDGIEIKGRVVPFIPRA